MWIGALVLLLTLDSTRTAAAEDVTQAMKDLDGCLAPVEAPTEARESASMRDWLCRLAARVVAREADRDAPLWALYDQLPPESAVRAGLVEGRLDARLAALAQDPAPVAAGEHPLALPAAAPADEVATPPEPPGLAQAAPRVRDAWKVLQAAQQRRTVLPSAPPGEAPLTDGAALNDAIASYLRGTLTSTGLLETAGRYESGSPCGCGGDPNQELQAKAMAAALVETGAVDAARSVVTAQGMQEEVVSTNVRQGSPWAGLARRLGLDWEALVVASMLEGNDLRAADLAKTEGGARALLEASSLPAYGAEGGRIGDRDTVMAVLAALVEPGDLCDPTGGFSSIDSPTADPPLPSDVQEAALSALAERVGPDQGLDVASEAARQLRRLCRKESLPAFQAMFQSRFAAVRQPGAEALRAMGAPVRVAPVTPLRLRLLVDERPWTGTLMQSLELRDGSSTFGTSEVQKGDVELDRDRFLDRGKPVAKVILSAEPSGGGSRDSWFMVEVDPALLRHPSPAVVVVATTAVTFRPAPGAIDACTRDEECHFTVQAVQETEIDQTDGPYFQEIASEQPLQAATSWTVRLQRGRRYRAVVTRGEGTWTSDEFEPGTRPATVLLRTDPLDIPAEDL